MRRFRLSRRAVLRGGGVALGLPFLEAMVPSVARAASTAPLRFMAFFHPNGVNIDEWKPKTEGEGFELSPTLMPLAPVKQYLLVLSGMKIADANVGSHEGGLRALLTATDQIVPGQTESIDQVIAAKTGPLTRVSSLQLGLENNGYYDPGFKDTNGDGFADPGPGQNDATDHCGIVDHCHLAIASGTRLPNLYNPRVVFDRLFAGVSGTSGPSPELLKENAYRRGVLDLVKADARRLANRLGKADRTRLDEYLTGIRQIELAIEKSERLGAAACVPGSRPPGLPMDRTSYARLMCDLVVKAFECDATRVCTFMFGQGVSPMKFTIDGQTLSHHGDVSHHGKDPFKLRAKHLIDRWHIEQLAYFLQRLASVREGDATLLDDAVVFHSSDISDGDLHNHDDMPVLVAGRAGGRFRTGRHLASQVAGRKIGDLFVTILQAFGIDRSTFGRFGTGPLGGLA